MFIRIVFRDMRKVFLCVFLFHILSLDVSGQDFSATLGTKVARTIRLNSDLNRGWDGVQNMTRENTWQPALCMNGRIQVRPAFYVGVELDLARNSFNFNPDLGRELLNWENAVEPMQYSYSSLNVMPYLGFTKGNFDIEAQFVFENSIKSLDDVDVVRIQNEGADTLQTRIQGQIGSGQDFYQQFLLRYRLDSVKNKHLKKFSVSLGYGMRFLFPRASSNQISVEHRQNDGSYLYNSVADRRRNVFLYLEYRIFD